MLEDDGCVRAQLTHRVKVPQAKVTGQRGDDPAHDFKAGNITLQNDNYIWGFVHFSIQSSAAS